MSEKKEITFLIKVMNGGGAERVISVLSRGFVKVGYEVSLILTHQKLEDANLETLHKNVKVLSLEDQIANRGNYSFGARLKMLQSRLEGKLCRSFLKRESEKGLIDKYWARNFEKVEWLRDYLKRHKKTTCIAFLYDTIFLTLLANKRVGNPLIISERGDPEQSLGSKTTMAFLHSIFQEAKHIVFQSSAVRDWYKKNLNVDGTVIFNPIKEDLPSPFEGERQKKIVNFCRISEQKNLELLVKAYARLHRDYPAYDLYIYGDSVGNGAEGYLEHIRYVAKENGLAAKVHLLPGRPDVHETIRDYAMFVSSSDFEGMSNSMLEAMAMGMPVVCTDCPAGGARAVIQDHENGILVPIKDEGKLYLAMREIIENPELAEKLSKNARKLREQQAIENIMTQWMELIDDKSKCDCSNL